MKFQINDIDLAHMFNIPEDRALELMDKLAGLINQGVKPSSIFNGIQGFIESNNEYNFLFVCMISGTIRGLHLFNGILDLLGLNQVGDEHALS